MQRSIMQVRILKMPMLRGGTVKIAGKGIITPVAGDISAGELVTILNNIK